MTVESPVTFEPTGELPRGRVSLEASAGTGKTWTIAALVTRYVAEGAATLDELLVVTFTRAATAELRHRIRRRLTQAADHLRAAVAGHARSVPNDDVVLAHLVTAPVDELRARLERVQDALAGIDRGLISTIHGFAHQVLRSAGHIGDIDGQLRLVEDVDDLVMAAGRDLLVRLYAEESDDAVLAACPTEERLTRVTVERLRHPRAFISPGPADPDVPLEARELARVAALVGDEIASAKLRRGIMTFDDLLHQLAGALRDPGVRETVLATFRQRFRIALVDEAQDTDRVQWEILEALFEDRTLVIIGDPKQAIYRFRGADVHAYVDAVARPETQPFGLATNHRSDRELVTAVNALFRDATFGHEAISHRPVEARHGRRLVGPPGDAPLHLRVITGDGRALLAPATRRRIATDLAGRITRLLTSDATLPGAGGEPRRVTPGDLAVLVRAHSTVDDVTTAFEDAGIPYVVAAVGSVFDAPAARHWRTLLGALRRPSSTTALRALASSHFVGWDAQRLAHGEERDLDELATMAHEWLRVLRSDGVASLLRTIHGDTSLGPRLLGRGDGQRLLTDIEHLGELLHRSEVNGRGPGAMLEWLDQQCQRGSTDDIPAEERARRLESDGDAVTIMTVHASKGLEFPVVYLPYMMWSLRKPPVPFTTTGDRPVLELGGPDLDTHQEAGKLADAGENLRLAYVAMTRAQHRVEAWWWKSRSCTNTPLSKLLLRRGSDPRVSADGESGQPSGLHDALDELVRVSDGAVSWSSVPEQPPASRLASPRAAPEPVAAATFDRGIDRTWTRASYSSLTTPLARITSGSASPVPDHEPAGDAAAARDDEHLDAAGAPAAAGAEDQPLPLGAMVGGARVGTLVHDVYEHVDFAAPDLHDQLRRRLRHLLGGGVEDVLGLSVEEVVSGLAASIETRLGPGFGDLRLRDVTMADRLDELAFELPVATAAGTSGVGVDDIREVFASLPGDDPMRGYVERLDDPALARTVRGYLNGYVDLVLRRPGPGHDVFHVLDYKTNVLYRHDEQPSTGHYSQDALVAAMHRGHYPLQAALYSVALHRYLRWRLGDYDPARHLGAVGYLFVRGMVGPDTPGHAGVPAGVMSWRPPTAFVLALSDCLHQGKAAA